ncbi:MAG TPA: hypothetical protein VGL73_04285 [Caulobacteraceae bacterium]|jgi:transcriptional regulator NrdR family protein
MSETRAAAPPPTFGAGSQSFCCPACGGPTQVVDSRRATAINGLRRRRRCTRCGVKTTTMETVYMTSREQLADPKRQAVIAAAEALQRSLRAYLPPREWDEL